MKLKPKYIFYFLGLLIIGYLGYNYRLIEYGFGQAKGQFEILWEAREIEEALHDPAFPDSLKETLILVDEIKKFAVDSLGLKPNRNYETIYDQNGEEILWGWSWPNLIMLMASIPNFEDEKKRDSEVESAKEVENLLGLK